MVSVVITAYNVQPFIAQAIESVLGQTYKDIECVIVEDCSTDDTIAEIKRASIGDGRVRMVQNSENMGAGFRVAEASRPPMEIISYCSMAMTG